MASLENFFMIPVVVIPAPQWNLQGGKVLPENIPFKWMPHRVVKPADFDGVVIVQALTGDEYNAWLDATA